MLVIDAEPAAALAFRSLECSCHVAGPSVEGIQRHFHNSALDQRIARALSPQIARARIRDAAERATKTAKQIRPYTVTEPCAVEFDMTSAVLADICETIPVANRLSALTVGFQAPSIGDAIRWMGVCCMLGSHLS